MKFLFDFLRFLLDYLLVLPLKTELSLPDRLLELGSLSKILERDSVDEPLTIDLSRDDFTFTRETSYVVAGIRKRLRGIFYVEERYSVYFYVCRHTALTLIIKLNQGILKKIYVNNLLQKMTH